MIFVTDHPNENEKFYYAEDGKVDEALLAILRVGWKKFFSKWDATVDPQRIRLSFVQEHWDMATMDESLFLQLPTSLQKTAEGHRKRYSNGMERLERKVELLGLAKTLIGAPKSEALAMTTKVNGKKRSLVSVVAEELNEILKDVSNDGYRSTELYQIKKTEKF